MREEVIFFSADLQGWGEKPYLSLSCKHLSVGMESSSKTHNVTWFCLSDDSNRAGKQKQKYTASTRTFSTSYIFISKWTESVLSWSMHFSSCEWQAKLFWSFLTFRTEQSHLWSLWRFYPLGKKIPHEPRRQTNTFMHLKLILITNRIKIPPTFLYLSTANETI